MGELGSIDCAYRKNVRVQHDTEVADCRLLQLLTGRLEGDDCEVEQSVCDACTSSVPPPGIRLNSVISSVLYAVCDRWVDQANTAGVNGQKFLELQRLAEDSLVGSEFGDPRPQIHSCDVVICCDESSELVERAIQSVLDQQHAFIFVHLVDDGGAGWPVVQRFADRPNVGTYRNESRRGVFRTLHDLVPTLKTQFVAVQDPRTVSRPFRIADSVGLLEKSAAEFLGARLQTSGGTIQARAIGNRYARYIPPQTLVMRRASLVDMGGMALRDGDEDAELLYRAYLENRSIVQFDRTTVDVAGVWQAEIVGPAPQYVDRGGSYRHHARGYPMKTTACDVVLPFHGHLDYAQQALEGLLAQDKSEVVIHLIDDASPHDTSEFLTRWKGHPQIRAYRNLRNVGQFTSFNNVVPYMETELVAVQDADDISCPQRCYVSANTIRLADADVFGSAVEVFGESTASSQNESNERSRYRWSTYPQVSVSGYFVENPTAMFRVATFRSLGGFADLGNAKRNRASLDTEFGLRAYYGGARFAVSRDVLVKYRAHSESATQNHITGWGTPARSESLTETRRRAMLMQSGCFDPRALGALGCHSDVTQRLD